MKPLSEDLRRRIIAARESGESPSEVHRRFGVSRSSEARLWRQYQQSGHCRPKQIGGYRCQWSPKTGQVGSLQNRPL